MMPKYAAQAKQKTFTPQEMSLFGDSRASTPIVANDTDLQAELEKRYGAAFAQWIMDDLRRASML